MSTGPTLELRDLPFIHSKVSLLHHCGPSAIIRLSQDPTELPSGTMAREVLVDWLSRPGAGDPRQSVENIGWSGVPQSILDACETWTVTRNEQAITEEAAIGVMALLVHHLESAEILRVLQIGSGGDYLLAMNGQTVQIESSGIREDDQGYDTNARLKKKANQVLTKCPAGFASVVAFSHPPNRSVCCRLHFVTSQSVDRKQTKGRNKRPGQTRNSKERK